LMETKKWLWLPETYHVINGDTHQLISNLEIRVQRTETPKLFLDKLIELKEKKELNEHGLLLGIFFPEHESFKMPEALGGEKIQSIYGYDFGVKLYKKIMQSNLIENSLPPVIFISNCSYVTNYIGGSVEEIKKQFLKNNQEPKLHHYKTWQFQEQGTLKKVIENWGYL
jgi:hypothetical protein